MPETTSSTWPDDWLLVGPDRSDQPTEQFDPITMGRPAPGTGSAPRTGPVTGSAAGSSTGSATGAANGSRLPEDAWPGPDIPADRSGRPEGPDPSERRRASRSTAPGSRTAASRRARSGADPQSRSEQAVAGSAGPGEQGPGRQDALPGTELREPSPGRAGLARPAGSRPRTERLAGPVHPGRPGQSDRSGQSDRPGQSGRPGESSRLGQLSRPGESSRPGARDRASVVPGMPRRGSRPSRAPGRPTPRPSTDTLPRGGRSRLWAVGLPIACFVAGLTLGTMNSGSPGAAPHGTARPSASAGARPSPPAGARGKAVAVLASSVDHYTALFTTGRSLAGRAGSQEFERWRAQTAKPESDLSYVVAYRRAAAAYAPGARPASVARWQRDMRQVSRDLNRWIVAAADWRAGKTAQAGYDSAGAVVLHDLARARADVAAVQAGR